MPLELIREDITKLQVDVIVNAANRSLLGGGGVDGAIHRAAGPELLAQCRTLGGCETGSAKVTGGYKLPARHIIHTVGPVWQGGTANEAAQLRSCYETSLRLATELHAQSMAFPLISAGAYGYPKKQALEIAMTAIAEFLQNYEMQVYLVIFDNDTLQLTQQRFAAVTQYIDDHYVAEHSFLRRSRDIYAEQAQVFKEMLLCEQAACAETLPEVAEVADRYEAAAAKSAPMRSLSDVLGALDDTFSQRLLRLIDQKGYSDVEAYKKANIDRKLFSKIRSDKDYKPSKATALAFAIALSLSLDETRDLLLTAGFALSHSSKFDVIIEYFITRELYNIHKVNEALFAFEQPLLGA